MSEIGGKTYFVFKCSECLQIIEMLSFQQFKQQETSLDQAQACHAPPLWELCLTLHDVYRQRICLTASFVFCHL